MYKSEYIFKYILEIYHDIWKISGHSFIVTTTINIALTQHGFGLPNPMQDSNKGKCNSMFNSIKCIIFYAQNCRYVTTAQLKLVYNNWMEDKFVMATTH